MRLMTSHAIVVLIAVAAIGLAADTFFRLFLVSEETSRLVDRVSAVAREVVVPGDEGSYIIRSEQSVIVDTLNLAGIEVYAFPPEAVHSLRLTDKQFMQLRNERQLFRKKGNGWFSLPELELYLVDSAHKRLILLKNPMKDAAKTVANMRRTVLYSSVIALVLAVLISYGTARYILAPIRQIQTVARQVVRGDFRHRVQLETYDELQDLAQTYNQTVDRVEETIAEQARLDQLRKEFISNVSHEFRIPLTSLGGFLELLEQNKIPDRDRARVIAMMRTDVDRLSRLVHESLDLSRLQTGKIALSREQLPLASAVESAVERLMPQAEQKNLHLEVTVPPHLSVYADEDRLQQILLNLIGNAVQHSPERERVRISARAASDPVQHPERQPLHLPSEQTPERTFVEIAVENSGTTIPEQELPYVFERFTKVDKSRSQRGTGLGLAIAAELVHLHGGTIYGRNLPDLSGVRFAFRIPARERLHGNAHNEVRNIGDSPM